MTGSITCSLAGTASAHPWAEPDPAACPVSPIVPASSAAASPLTAVLSLQNPGPLLAMNWASESAYDVQFPSGSTATGLPGCPSCDGDRWSSMIDLSQRFVLRALPDSGDLSEVFATNFTGITDNANEYVYPRVYRRAEFDQYAQLGGEGPAHPDFGQVEIQVRDAAGAWLTGADVTFAAGSWESAWNLVNTSGRHTAGPPQPGSSVQTVGGNVFLHNVCPGMLPVSVTNAAGAPCWVAPGTSAVGTGGIDLAVVADEWSMVQFTCPQ